AYDRYWNSTRVYPLAAFDDGRADPSRRRADFDARIAAATARFPALAPDAHDPLGQAAVGQELAHPPLTLQDGHIQVWCDDPEKVSGRSEAGDDPTTVTAHMLAAVRDARSSLLLVSPYFVPGTKGVAAIEDARRRGIEVSLLTNSMAANDEPFVSAAYARYREHLLKIGVDVAEISPHRLGKDRMLGPELGHSRGRMHAKLIVIDGRSTFVGSMNLDLRSSRENTELGLMIDSPILATQVAQLVAQLREIGTYRLRYDDDTRQVQWLEQNPDGVEIFDDEPGVDLFTRMKVRLLSPFIGEGLL
ncbi:MAG TPA: phospholipase D-like domain-containing protein, partial [Burkholderiaceae bacterium]